MTTTKTRFQGAWLTDIDDTLFRSGEQPSDEQIEKLADFIRKLQSHDILWAPVSGVAIEKMGPRILYRLPADVRSHVIYYGGEGSSKHFFDPERNEWVHDPAFERHFSPAQSVAIIGPHRLRDALLNDSCRNLSEQEVDAIVSEAEALWRRCRADDTLCLIDELEQQLEQAGFDPNTAQTWFRGGAVSWMMLGDISVEYYKPERETLVRSALNNFLYERLLENDGLRELGDGAVTMPYRHATRGIKMVLEDNDKARAAEDLIAMGIPAEDILFTGNELFAGGNDDSVRRVDGITLLSVGEREDPGVINGGVQTEATWEWMDLITGQLEAGMAWRDTLRKLPEWAKQKQLNNDLVHLKSNADETCPLPQEEVARLPDDFLLQWHLRHQPLFLNIRKCLEKLKTTEYELVARLASLKTWPYDHARKIIHKHFSYSKQADQGRVVEALQQALLPEIKLRLQQLLLDQTDLKPKKIKKRFREIERIEQVRPTLRKLIDTGPIEDAKKNFDHATAMIEHWATDLDNTVTTYFERHAKWCRKRIDLQRAVMTDPLLDQLDPQIDRYRMYRFYRWLSPRLEHSPHFKDLDKPTIVLVSGTSGVGKSTISQQISLQMGIPTGFSSDVASRSVMRQSMRFLLGDEIARETFPEIFGSSFEKNELEWFYAHALLTMVGVTGNIDRLIKENISAVIDGVALIPGTVAERYFESANIVWIVICVSDEAQHYARLTTRSETGVERGGSERYQRAFAAIRQNHDHLVTMAKRASYTVIDNTSDLRSTIEQAVARTADPFAERGRVLDDPMRDRIENNLQERITWDIQKRLAARSEIKASPE